MRKQRQKADIVSIFGEVEELVARQMMTEGKGISVLAPTDRLSLDQIPQSVKFNALGQFVKLVVIVPRNVRAEFEQRIEQMRM